MIAERSRSLSSEPNPVGRASRFARADESARDASGHRVGEPSGVPPQRHRLSVVMQAPSTLVAFLSWPQWQAVSPRVHTTSAGVPTCTGTCSAVGPVHWTLDLSFYYTSRLRGRLVTRM